MSEERDKYLTEAMGECWHEGKFPDEYDGPIQCEECSHTWRHNLTCQICGEEYDSTYHRDFSHWFEFGLLWEWAQKQEWWNQSLKNRLSNIEVYIHPDRFADALYQFLKERTP